MNLNTRFFTEHNYQHRLPARGYRSPLSFRSGPILHTPRSSFNRTNRYESFLPPVITGQGHYDGEKPFHRNDFANNVLFVAKQKLAGILHDQTTKTYDRNESEQKARRLTEKTKQQVLSAKVINCI